MKKLVTTIFTLMFIISSLSVLAEGIINLPEAGVSLKLDKNMEVFTRDVSKNDPRLLEMGFHYESLMASFEKENIYMNAVDTNNFNEIVVMCESTGQADYSQLTPADLYNVILAEESVRENNGRIIIEADLYEHESTDFVMIHSEKSESYIEYMTVYNGKKIKIRFVDYGKNINSSEKEAIESVVDSIVFTEVPLVTNQPTPGKSTFEPSSATGSHAISSGLDIGSTGNSYMDSINHLLIAIAISLIILTLPVLIFRFVFLRNGLSKNGALAFTIVYTLAMVGLFYFLSIKHPMLNLSEFLCLIPLVWSFVVYNIVKRKLRQR